MIFEKIIEKLWKKYTLGFRPCRFRIWHLIFDHLTPSENFSLSFSHLIRGGKKFDIKIILWKLWKNTPYVFLIRGAKNMIKNILWKLWKKYTLGFRPCRFRIWHKKLLLKNMVKIHLRFSTIQISNLKPDFWPLHQ